MHITAIIKNPSVAKRNMKKKVLFINFVMQILLGFEWRNYMVVEWNVSKASMALVHFKIELE